MNGKRIAFYLAGLASLIVLIITVDKAEDWLTHVSYPFDVWRMDLDDILANLGLFLAGSAAIWTVKLKADRIEHKLNGGMMELAHKHVQENEVIIGLVHRLDKMETERKTCIDELKALRQHIEEL